MMDKEKLKESTLINLRCVTLSCKEGIPVGRLQSDYKLLIGTDIPHKNLGYSSLQDFLQSIPEVVRIKKNLSGESIVEGIANSSTTHLANLISKQKNIKAKSTSTLKRPALKKYSVNHSSTLKPNSSTADKDNMIKNLQAELQREQQRNKDINSQLERWKSNKSRQDVLSPEMKSSSCKESSNLQKTSLTNSYSTINSSSCCEEKDNTIKELEANLKKELQRNNDFRKEMQRLKSVIKVRENAFNTEREKVEKLNKDIIVLRENFFVNNNSQNGSSQYMEEKNKEMKELQENLRKELQRCQDLRKETNRLKLLIKSGQESLCNEQEVGRNLKSRLNTYLAENTNLAEQLEKEQQIQIKFLNHYTQEIKDLNLKLAKEKELNKDYKSQIIRLNSLLKAGLNSLTAEQKLVKLLKEQLEVTQLAESDGSGDQNESNELPEGQEPDFPLAELARLDEKINRPRWCVPVFPKDNLEVLLEAAINLSKLGIDHHSEACQRFYRDGLTISFTKILTDEAVSDWKFEIHRCIMKNCEHLVKLCVLKLKQDCLPLLELLAMVLNPNSKFQSFNGTRPSETVPTGSQIPDEEVFARPANLWRPKGWLVDLINVFGSQGGFSLLLERFQSHVTISVPVIAALIRPFGKCHDLLTVYTIEKYFMPIFEIVLSFLYNLTDDELKKEAKNETINYALSGIVKALKCLAAKVPNQERTVKELEIFRLKIVLILRLPQISSINGQMNALNKVNKAIASISSEEKHWLTTERVAATSDGAKQKRKKRRKKKSTNVTSTA